MSHRIAKSQPSPDMRASKQKKDRSPCPTCKGNGTLVLFLLPNTCDTCRGDKFVERRPVAMRFTAEASSNTKTAPGGAR